MFVCNQTILHPRNTCNWVLNPTITGINLPDKTALLGVHFYKGHRSRSHEGHFECKCEGLVSRITGCVHEQNPLWNKQWYFKEHACHLLKLSDTECLTNLQTDTETTEKWFPCLLCKWKKNVRLLIFACHLWLWKQQPQQISNLNYQKTEKKLKRKEGFSHTSYKINLCSDYNQ